MTEHRHTLVTSLPAEHVSLVVQTSGASGRWHRVLNILHDEGIVQSLSDPAFRTLYAFLRLNCAITGTLDSTTGLVNAPLAKIMTIVKRGRTYVYSARAELIAHPRGLLAERERDRYAVLPAFEWAARPHPADSSVRTLRTKNPHPADESCAPSRERARAPYQTRELVKTQNQSAEPEAGDARGGFGMGWPEWTLFGHRAIAAGDVRGVLADMRLGGPLLEATAVLPGLSVAEIVAVAGAVANDPGIRNPMRRPVAVAWRLFRARGMAMPQSHKGGAARDVGAVIGTPARANVAAAVAALATASGLEEIRRRRGMGA